MYKYVSQNITSLPKIHVLLDVEIEPYSVALFTKFKLLYLSTYMYSQCWLHTDTTHSLSSCCCVVVLKINTHYAASMGLAFNKSQQVQHFEYSYMNDCATDIALGRG